MVLILEEGKIKTSEVNVVIALLSPTQFLAWQAFRDSFSPLRYLNNTFWGGETSSETTGHQEVTDLVE